MDRTARAASSRCANRRTYTSEDQNLDERGSTRSVHVFVVDDAGDPEAGQDVAIRLSDAGARGPVSHQYTDIRGHAEFLREHPAKPLQVEIVVRGESFGPYIVEKGARYTVELSGE